MDKLGDSESPPTGLARQPPGRSGDEAPDGLGGDRRLARGAECLRSPPRSACQPRRRPIARRRRFAPLRRRRNPPEAQEGAFLDFLFIIYIYIYTNEYSVRFFEQVREFCIVRFA